MSQPIEKKRHLKLVNEEDDDRRGSQGGAIEFEDFINLNGSRLSKEEERQKLIEHESKTSGLIDRGKKRRDQSKDVNKQTGNGYSYGVSSAYQSVWERHPIIGESAQYDGADPDVSLNPNLNEAETNAEEKQELKLKHQLENRPELTHQNRNTPTFRPPGT